jgi:hypothetical protein
MAKRVNQDAVQDTVNRLTGAQADPAPQEPDPKKGHPIAVSLTRGEVDELAEIAKELGVARHAVLQYAARKFLSDWRKGKRPNTTTKTVLAP